VIFDDINLTRFDNQKLTRNGVLREGRAMRRGKRGEEKRERMRRRGRERVGWRYEGCLKTCQRMTSPER
jgi:hypothetical protein